MFKNLLITLVFAILSTTALSTEFVSQGYWWGGPIRPGPETGWWAYFHQSSDLCYWEESLVFLEKNPMIFVDETCDWPVCVYSCDIDADGDEDLIGAVSGMIPGDDDVLWWENLNGDGSSWGRFVIDPNYDGAISVVSDDIDGDGTMDVIGGAYSAGVVSWWANTAGTGESWTEYLVDDQFMQVHAVASADVDEDGDIDILGTSWLRDEIVWWENTDGLGVSWEKHIISSDLLGTNFVVPCDVNNDNHCDVIGLARDEGEVYWWQNTDGTGTVWEEHIVSSVTGSGPYSVAAGDIDNDSDLDVVIGFWGTLEFVWCENVDGIGTSWSSSHIGFIEEGTVPYDVDIADMDNDGDCDIIVAAANTGGDLFWYENSDGSGQVWIKNEVHMLSNAPSSVHPADLNGDGVNDLVSVLHAGKKVSWWNLLDDYTGSGWLESTILDTEAEGTSDYDLFTWIAADPVGTTLNFQLRSSNDPEEMGSWSNPLLTSPVAVDSVINDGDRYFQYRVNMTSTDPDTTPVLDYVTISWAILGIEEQSGEVSGILSLPLNPVYSTASVVLTCPEPQLLAITVYDICGRNISIFSGRMYSEGTHSVLLGDLPPGVYVCTLSGDRISESVRFAVLE